MIKKLKENLEYKLYGLVPYQLIGIQKGIQFGHALQEYNNKFIDLHHPDNTNIKIAFDKWRKHDKTFIILNGGTTNKDKKSKWYGTLNQHLDELIRNNIIVGTFYEPDMGDQLSAVVFLVDERVFNFDDYPDVESFFREKLDFVKYMEIFKNRSLTYEDLEDKYPEMYKEWLDMVGGKTNAFLKGWLPQFDLS